MISAIFWVLKIKSFPERDLKKGRMNVLIMHYIDSVSEGEKFLLKQLSKKRSESISEDEISKLDSNYKK